MNKQLRTEYPAEFKSQAVQRAKAGDRSVRSLEQELGLSPNLLRQWVQQYDKKGVHAFVRKGESIPATTEVDLTKLPVEAVRLIRGLQREVAELKEDKVILKKALTLVSSEQK